MEFPPPPKRPSNRHATDRQEEMELYMKDNYPMNYSVAMEDYANQTKKLYFDPRNWTPKDVKMFFDDLQICNVSVWEYHVNKLTKVNAAAQKRISAWMKENASWIH